MMNPGDRKEQGEPQLNCLEGVQAERLEGEHSGAGQTPGVKDLGAWGDQGDRTLPGRVQEGEEWHRELWKPPEGSKNLCKTALGKDFLDVNTRTLHVKEMDKPDFIQIKDVCSLKGTAGTSSGVQWLRICLPTQGTWVRSLLGKLRYHMLWGDEARTPQPREAHRCNYRAHAL